jgi:hypothetical protein
MMRKANRRPAFSSAGTQRPMSVFSKVKTPGFGFTSHHIGRM